MQRSFLDFKFNENSNPSNSITSNSFDIHVRVFTDISGNFAWLGIIPFREFAKRIGKHVEITESETTDNKKLYELSALWRDISPKIGGYLYGDIEDTSVL